MKDLKSKRDHTVSVRSRSSPFYAECNCIYVKCRALFLTCASREASLWDFCSWIHCGKSKGRTCMSLLTVVFLIYLAVEHGKTKEGR